MTEPPHRLGDSPKDLLTHSKRSMRYHAAWERHFHLLHRLAMAGVFMGGSAVFAQWMHTTSLGTSGTALIGAFLALIATLEMVFDVPGKLALHKSLYQRFATLAEIITSSPPEQLEENRTTWNAQIYSIYRDEPPTYRAANAQAHNQTCIELGNKSELLDIKWWQQLLRHWCAFDHIEFPYKNRSSKVLASS